MRKVILYVLLLFSPAGLSSAASVCGVNTVEFAYITNSIQMIGEYGAVLMISFEGAKYIIANNPEERESSRRGVIYIIIGVVILETALPLVLYLLCSN